MKKSRQLILGLVIAFAALYYTLTHASLEEIVESFESVNYAYLIPAVLLITLSYVLHAWRWRVLLSPIKKVEVSGMFAPMMVGDMGNLFPGRPGEFLRAYLLGKRFNIPLSSTLATILVERLFDVVLILLLFTWVLVFHAGVFNSREIASGISIQDLSVRLGQVTAVAVGVLIIFIVLLVTRKDRLKGWVRRILSPFPGKWKDKVDYLVEEFALGLAVVRDSSALVKVTVLSALELGANVFSLYPLYWAFELQDLSIGSLLVLNVMITLFVIALPTPAFLGSFNAGVLVALHNIMGEAEAAAVSFGMVAWMLNFLVIFVWGFFFILRDHLSLRKLVEAGEQQPLPAPERAE